MKRLFLMVVCSAALLAEESVSRLVQLKYITPQSTNVILSTFGPAKVRANFDNARNIIGLAGPLELVDVIEAAIRKLDVPPAPARNIELTFHILAAGRPAGTSPMPAELSGVVQQLGRTFGLKSFRLLETVVIRGRERSVMETKGILAEGSKGSANALYTIQVNGAVLAAGEKYTTVRLDGLRFIMKIPGVSGNIYSDASIQTDIDVREGQKVVVGKSNMDSTAQPMFLVVSAKEAD